jgi:hypothetical protein
MATGLRALLCVAARQPVAVVRVSKRGRRRSASPRETALRRVGDYRRNRQGTYCPQRIYADPGIAPVGSLELLAHWSMGQVAGATGGSEQACSGLCPPTLSNTEMTREPRTRADLSVQRVYEPSRLAAACLTSAYAQVVSRRQRRARSSSSSALASVSPVVEVQAELVDARARRAG